MRYLCSSVVVCLLLTSCVAPLHVRKNDVVARVNGEAYVYRDLISDRLAEALSLPPLKVKIRKTQVLSAPMGKLRYLALKETLAVMDPRCNLEVSKRELRDYFVWWRAASQRMLGDFQRRLAGKGNDSFTRELGAKLRAGATVRSSDPKARSLAEREIVTWKANLCLYARYGGGRVHRDTGSSSLLEKTYLEADPGAQALFSYRGYQGYVFPTDSTLAVPLDAALAHFEAAETQGRLQFTKEDYRSYFYNLYRNRSLAGIPPDAERAALRARYWASGSASIGRGSEQLARAPRAQ